MTRIFDKIKHHLPEPIKTVLRPSYRLYKKIFHRNRVPTQTYQDQLNDEIKRFATEVEVNDLPDIFHYWSNKYLVPKFTPFGFNNPNEFFLKYAVEAVESNQQPISILSIGAGNCDTEVTLAKGLTDLGKERFKIVCMDINPQMFERGKALATSNDVADKIDFLCADFNSWQANQKYHVIIANQSLHHVTEIEHLYINIKLSLVDGGKFITSDVIGRNGHQRWPEAMALLNPIWQQMPDRYKYNHAMQRFEEKYINHDCSTEGFEGIRAQDVLPLLIKQFDFELFIPFANLVFVFIDRNFGPNFNPDNPHDLAFIDKIHTLDEEQMKSGKIKPTQMLAVMVLPDQSQVPTVNPVDSVRSSD